MEEPVIKKFAEGIIPDVIDTISVCKRGEQMASVMGNDMAAKLIQLQIVGLAQKVGLKAQMQQEALTEAVGNVIKTPQAEALQEGLFNAVTNPKLMTAFENLKKIFNVK